MKPANLFLLTSLPLSCGGQIETPPPQAADASAAPAPQAPAARPASSPPVYLDPLCAARPASVAAPPVDVVVTVEPGWHHDGSDPKVRTFDGSRPSGASRYFVRDQHAPDGCAARDLEPGLVLFADEASP